MFIMTKIIELAWCGIYARLRFKIQRKMLSTKEKKMHLVVAFCLLIDSTIGSEIRNIKTALLQLSTSSFCLQRVIWLHSPLTEKIKNNYVFEIRTSRIPFLGPFSMKQFRAVTEQLPINKACLKYFPTFLIVTILDFVLSSPA